MNVDFAISQKTPEKIDPFGNIALKSIKMHFSDRTAAEKNEKKLEKIGRLRHFSYSATSRTPNRKFQPTPGEFKRQPRGTVVSLQFFLL